MSAFFDLDSVSNPRSAPGLSELIDAVPARRRFLGASLAAALLGLGLAPRRARAAALAPPFAGGLAFAALAAAREDRVRVPEGFVVDLLYAWGDPVSDGPRARADASDPADAQAGQAGMHHDGMQFFPFDEGGQPSATHGLLCINHEYTDDGLLHPDGMKTWTFDKVRKAQNAHGVSVIEVRAEAGRWQVVRPSRHARRITARTPVAIAGPAAGSPLLRTQGDRRGNVVFGTLANCAMGATPWGTYLTCEENFDSYFNGPAEPDAAQKRYGLRAGGAGCRWHEHDARFDVATEPNEPHRFGWVVEIDPRDPFKAPVKRTALGRFKHESATVTQAADGRIVIYMGDDERREYLYKYVSERPWKPGQPAGDLLDRGTLHVARLAADGSGEWVPLTHGADGLTAEHGFADQAAVLVHARLAADRVGATPMDRPEWIAVHPRDGEVYVSLTGNRERSEAGPGNPRAANAYGHILRWREAGGDAAATRFAWSVFLLAGDPAHEDPARRGTVRGDAFANPDGLWFDPAGRLWIQTDMSAAALGRPDYAAFGNNQILVADTETGQTRRFLTGPHGCEITGLTGTPDGRALFVNIQHPGERSGARSDPEAPTAVSAWPANQFPEAVGGRPRSATVVIRRADGAPFAR